MVTTAPVPRASAAARALAQYRGRAARYDAELLAFEPVRCEALPLLQLKEGDTVLDVGCGTGLSFEPLLQRVGPGGRVIGIEPSPEMIARARERVQRHGWSNVALLNATADAAALQGQADAAMFHFTHDVLRNDACIANVLAHLKPGARVAASGLQWAPWWLWPVNGFVMAAALYSVTNLEGLGRPWSKLAAELGDVQVRTTGMGAIYIVSGTKRA
jgi:SAM-dependent methyltransferase